MLVLMFNPPSRRCLHFEVVGGLEWSNDPENYAGGSVATGRDSHAGKVMTQSKRDTPVLRSRGWACGRRQHTGKNYTAEMAQENNSGRCKKGRLKREKDYDLRMKVGSWNVTARPSRRGFKEDESEKLEREL